MKILVVDDELVSQKKMTKILSSFGTCDGVKTGKAALGAVKKALEEWRLYSLITLDISMPDISGIDVLTVIRKMETARGLADDEKSKILMVTSHSDIETVKACVGKCDGYIIKPFNKEVMTRKIKETGLLR
jgi:two-component system, chemotaxis family, chemotaxis protein CheY